MSVKYKVRPKGQPGVVGGGQIKYYASIERGDKIEFRSFLDETDELNIAHPGVYLAVLESFLTKVNYHLVNGRAVELGQLGSFYPSINSSSSDTPEAVDRRSIKRFKVIYRPSILLRDRLANVKFEKINNGTIEQPAS